LVIERSKIRPFSAGTVSGETGPGPDPRDWIPEPQAACPVPGAKLGIPDENPREAYKGNQFTKS